MRTWKNRSNSMSSIYKWSPSNSLQLWYFVRELQFFSIFDKLSTEMNNEKNFKCRVRKNKKSFFKFNDKFIDTISVKFSTSLIFSPWNFVFYFWWTVYRDEKWLSPRINFVMEKFGFRDFRFKIQFKTFWIVFVQKFRFCHF